MNFILFLLWNLTIIPMIISKKHKHKHKQKHQKKEIASSTLSNEIPLPTSSSTNENCPCASSQQGVCRGGLYVDYYYYEPYSGYPANSSYLPPEDSVPVIVERLTDIRDTVKSFIQEANGEDSDVKKAIYVKNNFAKVQYILQAVNNAANTTISS